VEDDMADKKKADETSVLGDINPVRHSGNAAGEPFRDTPVSANDEEADPLEGAAKREPAQRRSGSRDVTEANVGSPTTGGSRNMHSTGGASGMDIGNRPE
jgi:hypothetical protein